MKLFDDDHPGFGPFYKRASVNPVYWSNKANKLYVAADVLWKSSHNNEIEKSLGYGNGFSLAVAFNDGLFGMICGLSLELELKACILGKEKKIPETHALERLAREAEFKIGHLHDYAIILTEYISWYGKYPTPKAKYNHLGIANSIRGAWDKVLRSGLQPKAKKDSLLDMVDKTRPECEINWKNFKELSQNLNIHYRSIRDVHLRKGGRLAF